MSRVSWRVRGAFLIRLAGAFALLGLSAAACSSGSSQAGRADASVDPTGPDPSQPANPAREAGSGECPSKCSGNQVCQGGACVGLPEHCPCPKESYCELSTNTCHPGCTSDEGCNDGRYCDTTARECKKGCRQAGCGANEVCDPSVRACLCQASFHLCSGKCVAEGLTSCGPSCTACAQDPNGSASCDGTACRVACDVGFKDCAGKCATCPTANASSFACTGGACVAATCTAGNHACSGKCVTESVTSCGASCKLCSDATQGACSSGSCFKVVPFPAIAVGTTCAASARRSPRPARLRATSATPGRTAAPRSCRSRAGTTPRRRRSSHGASSIATLRPRVVP